MEDQTDILMIYLRLTQHMSRLFRCHLEKLRLTFPQALALNVLGQEGPLPLSALAERMGSANSTISGVVDRLEKLDLAKRERSGADRRVIYVGVTPKYRELCQETQTDVGCYFDSVLSDLSAQEHRNIVQALRRLDEALLQAEGPADAGKNQR